MRFFLIVATFFLCANIHAMEKNLLNQKDESAIALATADIKSDDSSAIELTGLDDEKPDEKSTENKGAIVKAGSNALKGEEIMDQPKAIWGGVFLYSLSDKNAEEFIKSLQDLFKVRRVCKKFNTLIVSKEFARFVGKEININELRRFKMFIEIGRQARSLESLSPLHYAVQKDKKELVSFLIKAGADVDQVSGEYGTMHYVKSCAVFDLLQAAGIDIDQPRDRLRRGPLFYIAHAFGEKHALTNRLIQATNDNAVLATEELEEASTWCSTSTQKNCILVMILGVVLAVVFVPIGLRINGNI